MNGFPWKGIHYSPITVGIGERFVHLLQLEERGGTVSLHAAERVFLDPGGEGLRAVVRAVRPVLFGGTFHGNRALLCLKGRDLYIQHQRFSRDGEGSVEDRIRGEFQRRVTFDLERAEIRHVTAGRVYERGELMDELILMVADREMLDRKLDVLEILGLQVAAVGAEPVGLEQLLLRFPGSWNLRDGAVAFLGLGASRAELVVVRQEGMAFTRSVPVGGRKLTRVLARKLEIDEPGARRLKEALSRGERLNPTLRAAALAAVRPVTEELCAEVLSCFRYFETVFKREKVQGLVLAGWEVGGIMDAAFVEKVVGLPVRPWNGGGLFPEGKEEEPSTPLDSGFAPLAGLAAEALDAQGSEAVDFMPREVKRKRERHRNMTHRLLALASVLLLMVLFLMGMAGRRRSLDRMRILVKGQSTRVEMKSREMLDLERKEAELKRKQELLGAIRPAARISRILAEVCRAAGPGITLRTFRVDRVQPLDPGVQAEDRGEAPLPAEGYTIQVKGLARTSGALSDFIQDLAKSRAFASIREDRYEDEKEGPPGGKSFSVTLEVGREERHEIF